MSRPIADGILNLNKPKDVTSMDMVRLAKRLTRVKRVGHAGTLDPIASGVLPLCFGQATRLMEFLVNGTKVYQAELTLGADTDTYDAYGTTVSETDPSSVTRSQVESLLPLFVGTIQQQPPMYSALKREGKRLYELARAGVEVERPLREVSVSRLVLLDWAPPKLTVETECGRGFYMRTLAHDLGVALRCGAHLSELTRLRAGPMWLENSVTPEQMEEAAEAERWEELLAPPDAALLAMVAVTVEPTAEHHLRNGQAISLREADVQTAHLEAGRAYSADGRFLGVVRFNRAENQWQPQKLFNLPNPSPHAPPS